MTRSDVLQIADEVIPFEGDPMWDIFKERYLAVLNKETCTDHDIQRLIQLIVSSILIEAERWIIPEEN